MRCKTERPTKRHYHLKFIGRQESSTPRFAMKPPGWRENSLGIPRRWLGQWKVRDKLMSQDLRKARRAFPRKSGTSATGSSFLIKFDDRAADFILLVRRQSCSVIQVWTGIFGWLGFAFIRRWTIYRRDFLLIEPQIDCELAA